MTTISFGGNEVLFKISGNNFIDILELAKEHGLTYHPKTHLWGISPHLFITKDLLSSFSELGEVYIDRPTLEAIRNKVKPIQHVFPKRIRYNPEIVNFSPLKGISPNETYQLDDIKRFLIQSKGCIFWEQRLGKAVWLSVHITHLFYYNLVDKAIILTPSSGVYNLRKEILSFSKIFKKEDIHIADKDNREPFVDEAKIIIMTYRTFLLISDHYYKKKNKRVSKKYRKSVIPFENWGVNRIIYADESQELGNPKSRQSKVLHMNSQYFKYHYLLSGTPTVKVEKLYSQIKFLDPKILPYSYNDFLSTIGNIGNRYSRFALNYIYPEKADKFLKSIEPYVSRRLLKDHLEISPDYIKKIYIKLDKKQRYIYEAVAKTTMEEVKESNNGKLELKEIKAKFPYLTLALHDPSLLQKSLSTKTVYSYQLKSAIENWKFDNHSKLEVLKDIVSSTLEDEEKIIIWGGHPTILNELGKVFEKYNPLVIHGETKEKGKTTAQIKDNAVEKFTNDKKTKILIANYQSMGTQINLTVCNTQVFFDRNYALIDYSQARKRIQGSQQNKNTKTYILIFENTLEQQQDLILENTDKLNEYAFDRSALSLEEWQQIFTKGV